MNARGSDQVLSPTPTSSTLRYALAFVSIVAFFGLLSPIKSSAQLVSQDVRVSISGTDVEYDPRLASHENVVVAVWARADYFSLTTAFSVDGGQSWTQQGHLPLPAGIDRIEGQPAITVDGQGTFYIVGQVYDLFSPPISGLASGLTYSLWRGSYQQGGIVWDSVPKTIRYCVFGGTGFYTVPCWDLPSLAYDSSRGTLLLSCTEASSFSLADFRNTILFSRSSDQGSTWTTPITLSNTTSNGSRVVVGPDGEVFVFWVDLATNDIVGRKSLDGGQSFLPAFTVARMNRNTASGPPGFYPYQSRQDPVYRSCGYLLTGSDFPSVSIDQSQGPRRGRIYVSWAEALEFTSPPGINSTGGGEPNNYFSQAFPLRLGYNHYAGIGGETSSDPDVYSFDLDAGTTVRIDAPIYAVNTPFPPPYCNFFQLFCGADTSRVLADSGIRGSLDGPLPPVVFTAPATGRYFIKLYATNISESYRLSVIPVTIAAGSAALDQRDIVMVSSDNAGATWSQKVRVNDDPPGFDDSIPELLVDDAGTVHVVWYDRRDDPRCGAMANTYWASSSDGAHFLPSVRLSQVSSPWYYYGYSSGSNIGDRLGLVQSQGNICAAWVQQDRPDRDIYSAIITPAPVGLELQNLTATYDGTCINLQWSLSETPSVTQQRVSRTPEGAAGPTQIVGTVSFKPEGTQLFADCLVEPGQSYIYDIDLIGRDGEVRRGGRIVATAATSSIPVSLSANPSPFSRQTMIHGEVTVGERVTLRIHDVLGREAITLFDGVAKEAQLQVVWDGRDGFGAAMPRGVYFAKLTGSGENRSVRIIRTGE